MHVVVVEKLSLKETGADEQGNQLTAEENRYCCSLHEILLQNELMMAVGSLYIEYHGEKKNETSRRRIENNRNVVAVVGVKGNKRTVVVVVEENNRNVVAVVVVEGN